LVRGRGGKREIDAYIENPLGLAPRRLVVALGQRDQLLGQALGLLGFRPGRVDGLVLDERGDEVAEEGLAVRGATAEVPVAGETAGHGCGG